MKKRNRGIIAIVCIMALLISSFATYTASTEVKADAPDWSTISYLGDGAGGGQYSNKYKYYCEVGGVVNIQKPGWANEAGIYATYPAAGISMDIAGYATDGAGAVLYLSSFTQKVTEITVNYAGGTAKAYVYYEDGAEGPTTTQDPSAPTTTTEYTPNWVQVQNSPGDGYFYDDSSTVGVTNWQNPDWQGKKEQGIHVTPGGVPSSITINGETTAFSGDGNYDVCYVQGAGVLLYASIFTQEITNISFMVGGVSHTLTIKSYCTEDASVNTDLNLALKGTASEQRHKEGTTNQLNDGEIYSWTNYSGVYGANDNPGSFDIVLDKAYVASSLDKIVVWWRTSDSNFYPSSYKVQFGYQGEFRNVDTNPTYPASGTVPGKKSGNDNMGRYLTYSDLSTINVDNEPVDTVRILVDVSVAYGGQAREVAVYAEDPQPASALPQADDPADFTASSPDYETINYTITAGPDQEDYTYYVYLGNTIVGEGVSAGVQHTVTGVDPGTYTLKVVSHCHGMDQSDGIYSDPVTLADPLELITMPENVAPQGTITSISSYYSDAYTLETCQCAIDGTPAAGEGATVCLRTAASQSSDTIDIDLGQQYKVSDLKRFVLAYTNDRTDAPNTTISVSTDGETYVQAASKNGYGTKKDGQLDANLINSQLVGNANDTFRYVRVVLSGGGNAWGYVVNQIAVIVDDGEEHTTEAPTTTAEPTTQAPHIEFTKAYRQEEVIAGKTHYAIWAYWEKVPGAAGYKSYIDEVKAGNEAKSAAAGWVWSDQNPPAGSSDTHVDPADQTKNNVWLDNDKAHKLIVIANDSEGNEICRGERLLDGKGSYEDLNYTLTNAIRTADSAGEKMPTAYAIYDDESSFDMRAEAANWGTMPFTYNDEYAQVTWGTDSALFNSPDKVTINGVDYTSSDLGPINNYADTLVQIHATASGGLHIGYNKVRVTKGNHFVTVIFRIGGVIAPEGVTATEQAGVPGSIRVDWTPGEGTPSGQVFRVYVDGDMKKGNLTGTSAIINNIDAGTHTVKVVGFYLDEESDGPETTVSVSTSVKYSSEIAVEGFQIRSNYPDDATAEEKNNVAYRTMCKAPKVGNTVKANGKTYEVADVGTIYAIDTNTKDKEGTNVLDASYTLLNETPITGQQYTYTGLRQYGGNNVTYGYVAKGEAIISDYKAGDRDNVYYAFTMRNMNAQMANTLWVRPFVVATDGTIIYGKSTAYTSVAEIANVLYTNSMSKNVTSHDYLYNKILHNSILQQAQNPFYRNTQIQYGWNANLYIGFRLVPDSWNGGQADEGQYVVVGDWKIHNSSHYNEQEEGKQAQASYKGNTNDEMQVRVDNPGDEFETDGWFWNWGIQMKLANQKAYHRLEDNRKYRMTITYNTTKPGIMRIKTEGNGAAKQSEGYLMEGHDLVYDFDSQTGGNSHSIEFTYSKQKYINNPGADPSIVICPGAFNVYPFTNPTSERLSRGQLHIKYLGQYSDSTSITEGVGGFPAGTIISDVDITFTEIDDFAPDSPNVLH